MARLTDGELETFRRTRRPNPVTELCYAKSPDLPQTAGLRAAPALAGAWLTTASTGLGRTSATSTSWSPTRGWGRSPPLPLGSRTGARWTDLTPRATNLCTQAPACHRLSHRRLRILDTGSRVSGVADRDGVPCRASKDGLSQATRTLALEWGGSGVIVSGIARAVQYPTSDAGELANVDVHG